MAAAMPHRTQEERRDTTRRAILDAALACLLAEGLPGLTTRRVAARAGVAPGTVRFHFPTRAAFVAAAVDMLARELLREHRERSRRAPPPADNRLGTWLDELWEICKGPAFAAMVELSSLARTDPDAQTNLALAERALTRRIAMSACDLFPDRIGDARFRTLIDLSTASMRGLAIFLPLAGPDELDRRWHAIRTAIEALDRSH